MNIIRVIPISRKISKDSLSYFTSSDVEIGSVVSVSVRNRKVPAIVLSIEKATDMKSELKSLDYKIKKIEKIKSKAFFSEGFIEAADETAKYFVSSVGAVIGALTTPKIFESINSLKGSSGFKKSDTKDEMFVIQGDDEDRYTNYKSLIREEFAKKSSVFICVPSSEDTKKISKSLEKGIEEYTYTLDNSLTKKELTYIWNKLMSENHSVLIIGTASFLNIPKNDIGTIIVEKESSRLYKTQSRPYIDVRKFAEIYAQKIGARLYFSDLLLRTETVWRFRNGDFHEQTPLKWRSVTTSSQEIIDMKAGKEADEPAKFKILSDELKLLIRENRDLSENMFIFSSRRGLSPSVVCGDCGGIVRCGKCSAPIVLHGASDNSSKNFFLCHKCGEKRTAEEKCKNCGSWKLTTLGIGIETIEKEVKKEFPGIKVFKIDYDTVKNHKKAEEIVEEFYSSPGSIILGTEMALLYLDKKIENTVVASIDSMFSVPDFRINEKIMNILLKIRSLTNRKLLIQTRQPEQKVFEYASRGNLIEFYRNEISEREKFGYPPFCILVKITFQGNKDAVSKEMINLKTLLTPYVVQIFPAFIETVNRKFVMHGLIKIPKETWIDNELLNKLSTLPQYYSVRIDPENLL